MISFSASLSQFISNSYRPLDSIVVLLSSASHLQSVCERERQFTWRYARVLKQKNIFGFGMSWCTCTVSNGTRHSIVTSRLKMGWVCRERERLKGRIKLCVVSELWKFKCQHAHTHTLLIWISFSRSSINSFCEWESS